MPVVAGGGGATLAGAADSAPVAPGAGAAFSARFGAGAATAGAAAGAATGRGATGLDATGGGVAGRGSIGLRAAGALTGATVPALAVGAAAGLVAAAGRDTAADEGLGAAAGAAGLDAAAEAAGLEAAGSGSGAGLDALGTAGVVSAGWPVAGFVADRAGLRLAAAFAGVLRAVVVPLRAVDLVAAFRAADGFIVLLRAGAALRVFAAVPRVVLVVPTRVIFRLLAAAFAPVFAAAFAPVFAAVFTPVFAPVFVLAVAAFLVLAAADALPALPALPALAGCRVFEVAGFLGMVRSPRC